MDILFQLYDIIGHVPKSLEVSTQVSLSSCATRPRGYKTFFMLNSVEHEILDAHM